MTSPGADKRFVGYVHSLSDEEVTVASAAGQLVRPSSSHAAGTAVVPSRAGSEGSDVVDDLDPGLAHSCPFWPALP